MTRNGVTSAAVVHWLMQRVSDLPAGASWLSDAEAAMASSLSREPRRGDWLLGRWTIKRAFGALAEVSGGDPPEPRRLEILAASDGAPEPSYGGVRVPEAVSLTHRAGRAVCVLGPPGMELGCDLELLEPRSGAFVADFLTPDEARLCEAAVGPESVLLANLYWSARESVLKALRLGLTVDTRRVKVRLGERRRGGGWSPFQAVFLEPGAEEALFGGWWSTTAGCVLTVASRPASAPPTRLDDGS